MNTRLSSAQKALLSTLAARGGSTDTIMDLVRSEWAGRGHAASYARVHRLARRGFVRFAGMGRGSRVEITPKGEAVIA